MNDLNLVLLTGRLTRDPESKETRGGTALCTFTLAVNRYFRRERGGDWGQETSFVDVETWGLLAKQCADLEKGQVARIQGRVKQERWQDGHGANKTKILVVAERVEWRRAKDEDDAPDAEPVSAETATGLED